jgi:hypothetical protein
MLFVTLFGPAIAANTIALERDGKTWDALLMAGQSPRSIDRGKFLGAYTHLCLYLLAVAPSFALPHVFGGVRPLETGLGVIMVFVVGALTVRFGLLLSAMVPTARGALVVTLLASAVLSSVASTFGFAMTSHLKDVGLLDFAADGPVFWPVAVADRRFGVDYVRYLVVVPVGAVVLVWSSLRELTLDALGAASGRARRHGPRHLVLLVAAAALLGVVPKQGQTLVAMEVLFSVCAFAAVLTVAGAEAAGRTLRRSLGVIGGTSAGFFTVALVALGVDAVLGGGLSYELSYESRWRDKLWGLLFYGPAFVVFVTGVCAFVRTLVARRLVVRAVSAVVTAVVAVGPVLVGVMARASTCAFAATPFGVFEATRGRLACAAAWWFVVGANLLFVAHRREGARGDERSAR